MKRKMLGVIIGAMLTIAGFAQNPFEVQATNQFKGVFVSSDFKLRMYEENGEVVGNLFWTDGNKIYPLRAKLQDSILVGHFANNAKQFPFSLTCQDDGFYFKAGSKTATMNKLSEIDFEDTWEGGNVKVILEKARGNQYQGFIFFNGQKYIFAGRANDISITGKFSKGSQSFPVTLMQDFNENSIKFTTGAYSKMLSGKKYLLKQQEKMEAMKENLNNNSIGMQFVFIEPGSFQMGSNNGDSDEKPIHRVTISNDFYMGKYEVTQSEYESIMGSNPSNFSGSNNPVEKVSWHDAIAFCKTLTEREQNAGRLPAGARYRLPTEAEWEYCAKGGNKSKGYTYSGSDSINSVGWYSSNSGSKTNPVGQKQANELGLYDMSGNVWEWCNDWKGSYSSGSVTNPSGASSGSSRVLRGGSWNSSASDCRSALRLWCEPSNANYYFGFRVLLVLE